MNSSFHSPLRTLALHTLAPALLVGTAASQNEFTFPLDGIQAGTGSPGLGEVTVTLDTNTGLVTADGTFDGMLGDALGVHIHGPAGPGENAPVKIVLSYTGNTTGTIGGGGQHAGPDEIEDMLCGLYYILVHTSVVGGGELRGQVVGTPSVAPYGSGVNPPNSLTILSGAPTVPSTLSVGLDNPTGSQSGPGLGVLFVANSADPLFNLTGSGTPLPGYGMSGPTGEVLINTLAPDPLLTFVNPGWSQAGTPLPFDLGVPNNKNLIGVTVYLQGALYADSKFGLTNGLRVYVGH